jgi:hypothetical protein
METGGRVPGGRVPLASCDADALDSPPKDPPPRMFRARNNAQSQKPFPGTIRRAVSYVYIGSGGD